MMRHYLKSPAYFFRSFLLVLLFVALAFVLGRVPSLPLPFLVVPLILQKTAFILVGSVLGLLGFVSMLVFFVLVALGLPLLSGGRGGVEVFLSPSVGFLLGYVCAALVVGLYVQKHWQRISFFGFVFANVCGFLVLYSSGIIGYMLIVDMPFIRAIEVLRLLIPLDIVKIILISFIATLLKKYYPLVILWRTTRSSVATTPTGIGRNSVHDFNR